MPKVNLITSSVSILDVLRSIHGNQIYSIPDTGISCNVYTYKAYVLQQISVWHGTLIQKSNERCLPKYLRVQLKCFPLEVIQRLYILFWSVICFWEKEKENLWRTHSVYTGHYTARYGNLSFGSHQRFVYKYLRIRSILLYSNEWYEW